MQQLFHLLPFPQQPAPDIQILGSVTRLGDHFSLSYQVTGQWNVLELPSSSEHPGRKHELWQTTCFEFFLGRIDSAQYWEFNLSPSGDWNVYRFHDYRQGMQEELAIVALPYQIATHPAAIQLGLSLDLSALIQPEQPIQIAITAVMKTNNKPNEFISYWALAHTVSQPDFHQRNSFILSL